jgi:hypothetical protein
MAWIERLRRQRWTSAEIATRLQLGRSTVARLLQRRGLARLRSLERPVRVRRYEWPHPGDLLHLDVKKLASIAPRSSQCAGRRTLSAM